MGRTAEEGTPRSKVVTIRVTETFGERIEKAAREDGNPSKYLRRLARDDMERRGIR